MAAQALYRRWRPQTFAEVIGQEHVTRTLQNALADGRVSHAYLFAGPRGTGKTSVARILAKAVNCTSDGAEKPCNQCPICISLTEGRSLDLIEIDAASNRGIDEIRDLREKVHFAPSEGRYKIYIVDEAHMLTNEAFNALLKTLEEPPSHVIFIFATTQPYKVPLTILSRCQRFDFRRISTKLILERLDYIAEQEKIQVEEAALALIAKKAEGSLRDGQSLLDQVISYGGKKITEDEVSKALGLASRDLFFQLVQATRVRDSRKGLDLVATVEEQGWDIEEFVDGLLDHLRHLLLAKSVPESPELMDLSHADQKRYREQGANLQVEDLLRMMATVSETEDALRYSTRPRFLLEMMVVKLAKMDTTVQLQELVQGLNRLLGKGGAAESQRGKPQQMAQEEPGTSQPAHHRPESKEQDQDLWGRVLNQVSEKKPYLAASLQQGQLAGLEDQSLTITFPMSCNFLLERAQQQKNREVIEGEASRILGKDVRVRFTMADLPEPPKKPEPSREPPSRKPSMEEAVKTEPILGTILEILDGELID